MKLESKSFPKEVRFLVSILAMGRIVHPISSGANSQEIAKALLFQ